MTTLTLDRMTCRRGGRMVFRDVSFSLETGEAALVRGPNGVGKSSLLRVLAGLVPLAGGEARFGDIALSSDLGAFQELIAYAGHQDAVKPALTIRQNIASWAGLFGTAGERVDAALAFFGLDDIGGRPAVQCSAGQRRRLGLARLMVIDRPVWLLDEPTVSLDAESSALVAQLVREHCEGGGLALIATHIDLGLGDAPVLEMTPISGPGSDRPAAEAVADAFLDGDWR